MLTVFIPPGEPTTFIVDGTSYTARMFNGRLVIEMPQRIFRGQLLLGKSGLLWERENPEAMEWLGQSDPFVMSSNAFPGAGRPPAVAPVVVQVAPVMRKLIAPEGITSFSHGGTEHKINKDGSITVDDKVASALRAHGFKDAA